VSVTISRGIRLKAALNGVELSIPADTILTQFGIDITAYNRDLTVLFAIMLFLMGVICLLVVFRLKEKK
jgi:hypothetical protein